MATLQKSYYSKELQEWVFKCPTCKKEVPTSESWYESETNKQKHFSCLKKNLKKK